jgi:uncharacterized membrane protein
MVSRPIRARIARKGKVGMNALEHWFQLVISYVVPLVEACGALVVVMGVARAIWQYLRSFFEHDPLHVASLRLQLGQSMVMGLEFQVAADILKTALSPTLNDMLLLGALIGVRTVLNYLLERELVMLSSVSEPPRSPDTRAGIEI